jgi:uncharacterized NAD-dependent epimerase/dehydratase family protein
MPSDDQGVDVYRRASMFDEMGPEDSRKADALRPPSEDGGGGALVKLRQKAPGEFGSVRAPVRISSPAVLRAVVYCDQNFGKMDGKTANGLVRYSEKYRIVGVIDRAAAGKDAGLVLDGKRNGIPVFHDLSQAMERLNPPPRCFIYGMAPLNGFLSQLDKEVIFQAMDRKLDIVNGLHEFLNDDERFAGKAKHCGVEIFDIRRPKPKRDLRLYSGRIMDVACPKIAVLGTDSAVGKRTTATLLTEALKEAGLNAVMVATGQTGLIQGARYGVALDAIPEQYISGEMEAAVVEAYENEKPDVLVIEGQGALSHPAYLSSCFIIRGSRPDAVILQHAPGRKALGDYPDLPMPTLESEIELVETFGKTKVIAVTINHENMTDDDVRSAVMNYRRRFQVAAADVLTDGCGAIVRKVLSKFRGLARKAGHACDVRA